MRIGTQRVTCKQCGTVSEIEIVVDAPVAVAVASITAMLCPNCAAGHESLSLGGELNEAPKPGRTVEDRAEFWRSFGDIGLSSMTIYATIRRIPLARWNVAVPQDPDDFQRCKRLLDLIPEWRGRLHEVAGRFPIWQPFADAWAELEDLWDEESPSCLCPKLYQRIQQLCAEGQNQ